MPERFGVRNPSGFSCSVRYDAFVIVYYFALSIDSKIFTISENYTIIRNKATFK